MTTQATDSAVDPLPQAATPPLPPLPQPTTTASSQPDPEPAPTEPPKPVEAAKAAPTPPPRDYAKERMEERIGKLTAQKAALERELAQAKATQPVEHARLQEEISAQAQKLAEARAAEIAQWTSFTGALNSAIEEGKREFGAEKYDKAVQALRGLHAPDDTEQHGKYLSMLQAVLDTGAAPKLIAVLGEDPNEAARIMSLSPTKMGVELGRLAFRDAEQVSAAPKPITPVSGVGRSHVAISAEDPERSDQITDMRVWMERRTGHVSEVNKRAGRRVLM